jgi:uncharacterized protein (DUF433 family)
LRIEEVLMDREWLTSDPEIVGGRLVFKGTRVTLETVLASLAEGDSMEAILKSFPSLTAEQVRATYRWRAANRHD